jgi:hypothetical protein
MFCSGNRFSPIQKSLHCSTNLVNLLFASLMEFYYQQVICNGLPKLRHFCAWNIPLSWWNRLSASSSAMRDRSKWFCWLTIQIISIMPTLLHYHFIRGISRPSFPDIFGAVTNWSAIQCPCSELSTDHFTLPGAAFPWMQGFREVLQAGISSHQCEFILKLIRDISSIQVFE